MPALVLWFTTSCYTETNTLTDRIESGQLAAHVDDEDQNNRLPVAASLEELVDGDAGVSVSRLLLHLLQLSEHFVRVPSQSQQGWGLKQHLSIWSHKYGASTKQNTKKAFPCFQILKSVINP